MKVELSIKDDKQLRNVINDMIKGQICALTRQEVIWRVQDELHKKMKLDNADYITELVRSEVKLAVKKAIEPILGRSKLDEILTREVKKALKELNP